MQVIGGKINEVTIFSDALFPDVISQAMVALTGADYGRKSIGEALASLRPQFARDEGPSKTLEALAEWMVASVDD